MALHRNVYEHLRHHRKRYIRFVAFFVFLMIFAIVEDSIVAVATGASLNMRTLTVIFIVSLAFTAISEVTEKLVEEKEPQKIARAIRKEEKAFKKELRKI